MYHVNLSHAKNASLLSTVAAHYDGAFDSAAETAAIWAQWWKTPQGDRKSPGYYASRLAQLAAQLADAATNPLPNGVCRQIWREVGDIQYCAANNRAMTARGRHVHSKPTGSQIRALAAADFVSGVYADPDAPRWLHIITAPRFINKYKRIMPMGRYRIEINLAKRGRRLRRSYGEAPRETGLVIVKHQTRRSGGCIHPHVYDGGYACLGEIGNPIRARLAGGFLFEAVFCIAQMLNTHNYGGNRDCRYWAKEGTGRARERCAFCPSLALLSSKTCKACHALHCADCGGGGKCVYCGLALPKTRKAKPEPAEPTVAIGLNIDTATAAITTDHLVIDLGETTNGQT